jgi:hypothetical protein
VCVPSQKTQCDSANIAWWEGDFVRYVQEGLQHAAVDKLGASCGSCSETAGRKAAMVVNRAEDRTVLVKGDLRWCPLERRFGWLENGVCCVERFASVV